MPRCLVALMEHLESADVPPKAQFEKLFDQRKKPEVLFGCTPCDDEARLHFTVMEEKEFELKPSTQNVDVLQQMDELESKSDDDLNTREACVLPTESSSFVSSAPKQEPADYREEIPFETDELTNMQPCLGDRYEGGSRVSSSNSVIVASGCVSPCDRRGTLNPSPESAVDLQYPCNRVTQAERQLKLMEKAQLEWQARETALRCRVEELENSVQVLTADLVNDRQHICTLSEAMERAERAEADANKSLQTLQNQVNEVVGSVAASFSVMAQLCPVSLSPPPQHAGEPSPTLTQRFTRVCLDALLSIAELRSPSVENFEAFASNLNVIGSDLLRADERLASAEDRIRELTTRLDTALDDAETFKAKAENAYQALETEKVRRQKLEERALETSEECTILRSTTTALTNQLEEAQLRMEQLFVAQDQQSVAASCATNSTDDDKRNSDGVRIDEQFDDLRDRICCLETNLEDQRLLREKAEREYLLVSHELNELRDLNTNLVKDKDEELKKVNEDLKKQLHKSADCEQLINSMREQLLEKQQRLEDLEQKMAEKSDLVNQLHCTIDNLVDSAQSAEAAYANDGLDIDNHLLKLLHELAGDFSITHSIRNKLATLAETTGPANGRTLKETLMRLLETIENTLNKTHEACKTSSGNDTLSIPDTNSVQDRDGLDLPVPADVHEEIRERDEKIAKLKNLLIKLKKELVEIKSKQQQSPSILANNIQSLQAEYDRVVDELEAERVLNRDMQKKVAQTIDKVAEMELRVSTLEDERRQLQLMLGKAEQEVLTVQKHRTETEAQLLVAQSEIEKARGDVDQLTQELSEHIRAATGYQVELSALQQQADKGRLAVDELQQADERQRLLEEQLRELREQLEQTTAAKADVEAQLAGSVKANAEATSYRERCNLIESDNERLTKAAAEAEQRFIFIQDRVKQLEKLLANAEESLRATELEIANISKEKQQLQHAHQNAREAHARIVRTLEGRVISLKKDLSASKQQLDDNQRDFDAYKMKVHSVMKTSKEPVGKKTEEVNETLTLSLKLKVDEVTQELSLSKAELEAAQEDLARLQERYELLEKNSVSQKHEFDKKLSEALELKEKEVRAQILKAESSRFEQLLLRHQEELHAREQAHRSMVEVLEEKLSEVRTELDSLKQAGVKCTDTRRSPDFSQTNNDVFIGPAVPRQPAEGSESTEISRVTNVPFGSLPFDVVPTPGGFEPLDKLLESHTGVDCESHPVGRIHSEASSFETFESLSERLTESLKQIERFTDLLNESEVNNLRLSEQVRLLKDEVRRLERNNQRDVEFGNLEYLKNVVLKYVTMTSERERLVPVLVTMLKLSPEERRLLQECDQHHSSWGLLPKFL